MIFGKKYNAPSVLHAAPRFIMSGEPFAVSVAVRNHAENAPEKLVLHVLGGDDYNLIPSDRYDRGAVSYMIYRADVPGSAVCGNEFQYSIDGNEFFCRVLSPSDMPELPPLAITEIFGRPKGKEYTCYIELFNPNTFEVDLSEYELLVYEDTEAPSGKPTGRIPLSRERGISLKPGECVAVWPLTVKNYDKGVLDRDDFIREINSAYIYTKAPVDEARLNIIPVDMTEIDAETGNRKNIDGFCTLPVGHKPTTLLIVPRGGDCESAVYTLVYSNCFAQWDTPVLRSSYWAIDPMSPRRAVNLSHADFATPGYPALLQTGKYDLSAPLPVILPISSDKEAFHGDRVGTVEFLSLPADKDHEIGKTFVSVTLPNGATEDFEAIEEHDGVRRARIPEEIFEDLSELEYNISAYDGARWVTLDGLCVPVYDNRGPRITSLVPSSGYAYDGTKPIVIKAKYTDISGIRIKDCFLRIDGKDVTKDCEITATSLTYEPKKPLGVGEHSMVIRLKDGLGNRTTKTVDFSVSDMSELKAYFGEVHAHTGESDANGFPSDAMEFAYDNGADFFAVTEHSHYCTQKIYDAQKRVADSFDRPGRFAALYGWEMTWNNTCGYWGHMNIIGSKVMVSDINRVSMPDIFKWLESEPDAVGMFNHPGDGWGDFESYGYKTEYADRAMALAEIKGRGYDHAYSMLLARGWHVAPSFNEDNHAPNWTVASPYITGILAPALTRENVMDAFRSRRVYSSADPTMKIFYKVNGEWMGAHIDNPSNISISLRITTENEQGIGLIEIIGEDNIVVARKNVGARREYEWNITFPVEFDYYYARISNNGQYSVTAPVWIENRGEPRILSMTRSASYDKHESSAVTLKLENPTEKTMTEVMVDFYLTDISGFSLRDTVPYAHVCLGKLKPGRSVSVTRQLPEVSKYRRVSAVVSAISEDTVKKTTAYILVSPVSITEVLCATEPLEKDGVSYENPFPYITLCNNSGNDITLSDAKLALWTTTGKPPKESCMATADGITIPARSAVVVWRRSPANAALTAGDFNGRYATAFTEGIDLYISDKHITSTSDCGRRLDLIVGGEVISRVTWNMGLRHGQMAEVGRAYKYRFSCDMSPLEVFCGTGIPNPGVIDYKQLGARREAEPTFKELRNAKKQKKADEKRAKATSGKVHSKGQTAAIAATSAALAAGAAALITSLVAKKK
ncbi:MAG: CehA/McbA family metallohydrolase [Eubacteriales bacterium]